MVIFTESLTTQKYLERLRIDKVGLPPGHHVVRGSNDSPRASEALARWNEEVGEALPRHARPSPTVAVRLALVHGFKTWDLMRAVEFDEDDSLELGRDLILDANEASNLISDFPRQGAPGPIRNAKDADLPQRYILSALIDRLRGTVTSRPLLNAPGNYWKSRA